MSLVCSAEQNGEIRLTNSRSSYRGVVEICLEVVSGLHSWLALCNNQWSTTEAGVVCGQLGYAGSSGYPCEFTMLVYWKLLFWHHTNITKECAVHQQKQLSIIE